MKNVSIQALVLAAGKSTRFNTTTTKLLHKICGQEMILYPVKVLESLTIPTAIIVGHQAEDIKSCTEQNTKKIPLYIKQASQQGTGNALLCSQKYWNKEHVLVMNGDMPLVTEAIIRQLIDMHLQSNADLTFVTSHNSDPSQQYGRVIEKDGILKIVEARHLKQPSLELCCVNAGLYLFKRSFLEKTIPFLAVNTESKECYITDLIEIATEKGYTVKTITAPFDTIRGVNTMKELWAVEHIQRSDLISFWMSQGVRFTAAHTVQLDIEVMIGMGTTIGSSIHLVRGTTIGKNCLIESFTTLNNAILGDNVHIKPNSLICNSTIGTNSQIGPFAHIQETEIGYNNNIGNFVEIKRTKIGSGTKIKHLVYMGDAQVGNNINIGAGTITCNYDGKQKHTTIINDNVFIGSNNTLIAPLIIEKNAFTAGGSVITDNVPAHALAIARARQITKENYKEKKMQHTSFSGALKTNNSSLQDL